VHHASCISPADSWGMALKFNNRERVIMLITKEWLKEKSACKEGYEWSLKQEGFENGVEVVKFLDMLVKADHWNWANWVIVRVMTSPQYLSYAIYSAEQVIDIYEKKYHKDDRPRKAIEAAKKVLENDTPENRAAAYAAASASAAASVAASSAAYAAAYASPYSAASAAYAAADAAYADSAYASAAAYADDSKNKMRKKILDYGISLLTNAEGGERG